MDGRGGCCIARYAHGADDMSKVNRIMLKFRPIAPKPVAGTTACDASSSESSAGRTKRKYNNNSNNNSRRTRRRKTTSSPENNRPAPPPVVTLPLLPETPDPKESLDDTNGDKNYSSNLNGNAPVWLNFEKYDGLYSGPAEGRIGGTKYSSVTVECVTDTWVEEGVVVLGRTDEERRLNLGADTCPGFVSDGYGRVTWTNGAYGEMVGKEGEGVALVLLAVKAGAVVVPTCGYSSFTCRVRVVQYDECGNERSTLTVPCDVWRMDCGGFAWRLDVKAALSLRLTSC